VDLVETIPLPVIGWHLHLESRGEQEEEEQEQEQEQGQEQERYLISWVLPKMRGFLETAKDQPD